MFKKILIANRGEIACRIIKTAKRMGIKTVAVYSDVDKVSKHVNLADEAYHLGPPPASESYLNSRKIIKIALQSGVEAIHPGYGFLSENPDFAKAASDAGLTFIGPPVAAIRAMGLKDAAKIMMEKAGVPIIPGYQGNNQNPEHLKREALKIGFPILIKARAGGGGKGMRKVENAKDFLPALASAQRESKASFGDGACIIEKYVMNSRHIEFQIFGDSQGNYIHLFERDCSIQRRHQKIIEETPAPEMTDELRKLMGNSAVQAARSIGYQGAGTVEFILENSKKDKPKSFYFMEMNTRLQVEHPVTEMVTGQDLVEWQLKVAAGERLPLFQNELTLTGSSIEARLYAEAPERDFLPTTGKLHYLKFPEDKVRVDSGFCEGDMITPYYDSMIAKIISHAATRSESLEKLNSALADCHIVGLSTNVRFLKELTQIKEFVSGKFNTGLVDQKLNAITQRSSVTKEVLAIAALAQLGILRSSTTLDPWFSLVGWRGWGFAKLHTTLFRHGEKFEVNIHVLSRNKFNVIIDGNSVVLSISNLSEDKGEVKIRNSNFAVKSMSFGEFLTVIVDADQYDFSIPIRASEVDGLETSDGHILSELPGLIKLLPVKNGQSISKGDVLVVLEAMKMEHTILATKDCRISEIHVHEGQQVAERSRLLTIFEEDYAE